MSTVSVSDYAVKVLSVKVFHKDFVNVVKKIEDSFVESKMYIEELVHSEQMNTEVKKKDLEKFRKSFIKSENDTVLLTYESYD